MQSSSRPRQISYRVRSHGNSSIFCTFGRFRVKVWYRWWWVFTRPGYTKQWEASMTQSAGRSSGPMYRITLSCTRMFSPRSTRSSRSTVTMAWALRMRVVAIGHAPFL